MSNESRTPTNPSMISRLLTAFAVFILAGGLYLAIARNRPAYGLEDVLAGKPVLAVETITTTEEPPVAQEDVPLLAKINAEVTSLIEAVAPAVVSVNTKRITQHNTIDFWGRIRGYRTYTPGLGSGVIISKEGHVVTNYHVVEGVDEIQVVLHDGTKCLAEKIGEDRNSDIALLRVINPKVKEYKALPFADSDQVKVGETVFAIGNPFGLRESVTQGIINHRDRQISDSDPPKFQTDAVINPGNSGGPLVNIRGEIVGINVAIFAGQQGLNVWQGIGLAIPANDARRAVDRIRNHGEDKVGYLGLRAETQILEDGLENLVLTEVMPGSPAEKAGLKPGDAVLRFAGLPVSKGADLFSRINRRPIGQPVEIIVKRGDTTLTLTATVADREESLTQEEKLAERKDLREQIGIEVQNISQSQRQFLPDNLEGVVVTAVEPDSPADGKLLYGTIIYEVDGIPIDSVGKFFSVISTLKGKTFFLKYIKHGLGFTVEITLP